MDSNSWEFVDSPINVDIKIRNNNESKSDEKEEQSDIYHPQQSSSNRYGQNVKNYETEWRDLCMMISSETDLKKLRMLAISGDLKISKFRSVIWNVLLGALSNDPESWIDERNYQRTKYNYIKKKHILDPNELKIAEERDNPLSQSKDSIWNQHFCDTELRSLIQQDVVRTNPNVDYYRKEHVQEIMINILFCYARQYPVICYRQGMHEILAPLIFVLHCDHQSFGHIQEETNISLDPILEHVLDPQYIEEDSYSLFCQIMNNLELFYRVNDMKISESGQLSNIPIDPDSPKSKTNKSSEIEVVHQLNIVRDKIFAKHDLHLHNHLLKLEIPLALFGIRWLRLLFGREFNLLDQLVLWDAIFGAGDELKLTYYIVVAMLIHIRDRLLSNDYTTCLTILMRYPMNADIGIIIRHALYMYEPDKYQCPPNAFVYVISSLRQRSNNSMRMHAPLANSRARSSIDNMPSTRKLRDDMRKETAKITKRNQADDGVVDGYSLDDPDVLKIELQDSYDIMSVARIKLIQYVSILRKHIPGNQVDELHQTLDGIEELCSLLKPKNQFLFEDTAPVDVAFEADDEDDDVSKPTPSTSKHQRSIPISMRPSASTAEYVGSINRVNREASRLTSHNRREVEMSLIRSSAPGYIDYSKYPQENPAGDRNNSD